MPGREPKLDEAGDPGFPGFRPGTYWPGNPGGTPPLKAWSMRFMRPPAMLFIIFCISMNCFMSLLTS